MMIDVNINGDPVSVDVPQPQTACDEDAQVAIYRAASRVAKEMLGPGQLMWNHDLWPHEEANPYRFTYVNVGGVCRVTLNTRVFVTGRPEPDYVRVKLGLTVTEWVEDNGRAETAIYHYLTMHCNIAHGPGKLTRRTGTLDYTYEPRP